jgi:asparagine synthase (glutamine-hydrolysing)
MFEEHWLPFPDFERQAMYLDTLTYLPNDILVKVDRATMAFSLEGRIPYLDHRIVEFAWRLPLEMKVRPNHGKWILRRLLHEYVPHALVERPKMGFGIPLDTWLRGPLREWAASLLDPRNLKQSGLFDPAPIEKMWRDHLSGRGAWQYHLWDILMFQLWSREQQASLQMRVEGEGVQAVGQV